jgi:hypothetical protein
VAVIGWDTGRCYSRAAGVEGDEESEKGESEDGFAHRPRDLIPVRKQRRPAEGPGRARV